MREIFGENGALKDAYNNFEFRQEQSHMAEFILERLSYGDNGLIEAGTGTGKTLAYLIPAIIYCMENDKILAVSTETKALQKQLIDKDIPLARKVINNYLDEDFSCSLCLGSFNYPCRRRFESLLMKGDFPKKDIEIVKELKRQFSRNEIFTRFDVTVSNALWSEISRESEACNYYNCPFSSRCAFQRARKEWMNSNLLIMNHYLFFANIAFDKSYLPKFDIVIFDEAHSLEEIASGQLGFDISDSHIMDIINRLYRKNRKNSLVTRIQDEDKRITAVKMINAITKEVSSFFENLRELFKSDMYSLRIRDALPVGEILVKSLKELLLIIECSEDDFDEDSRKIDFDIVRGRLFLFLQSLESIVYHQNSNFVYWIERNENELLGDIHLKGEPVSVSEIMEREVNSFYDSNLFVSATLTTNKNFSFLADRLGINEFQSLLLDSPFDYMSQVMLYLGEKTVPPNDPSYVEQSSIISAEIINHLEGNCLLLFTSYKMLEEVKKILYGLTDCHIYAQGDFNASETMERYIKDNGSILMGTHSFWQGIDLPGDLLRGVILMRLPFSVPDRPLVQARIEKLQEQGLNPFYNYQVPHAIIKFKQGFGRLIRSRNDKGIVAVLDSRILTKSYGRRFLEALPECRIVNSIDDFTSVL